MPNWTESTISEAEEFDLTPDAIEELKSMLEEAPEPENSEINEN